MPFYNQRARVQEGVFESLPATHSKAEKKGRTKEEVDAVICWLTGYDEHSLQEQIMKNIDYETFLVKPRK